MCIFEYVVRMGSTYVAANSIYPKKDENNEKTIIIRSKMVQPTKMLVSTLIKIPVLS